jgi:hypothetical protein
MAYTPFFQGTEATNIINGYLDQNVNANTPMAQPDMNQYGVFRNPYSPEGFYANETDQYPVEFVPPVTDEEGIPACPEGYIYDEVMKACRYVGFSEPNQDNGKTFEEERAEERPYMSIEDMKNASNKDLLDYMKTGYLSNSMLGYLPSKGDLVTLKNTFPTTLGIGLNLLGIVDPDMRKNAMIAELSNRGYFTGDFNDKGQEVFDIGSTPQPNIGFNEAQVPYGGAGTINEGVTGSYGGGEDRGSFQGGGGNVVINTPNPHNNKPKFAVNYDDAYGADI